MNRINNTYNLYEVENIATNLVFIDGITRCGKSIYSSIISSFDGIEHIQIMNQLEQIIPAVMLGGMTIECAKMMLRLSLNELSYNIQLSRNINFRETDQTGIANYKEPNIYWDRLKLEEGDGVIQHIRDSNTCIPFQLHDLMVNLDVVDNLGLDYKIIELYRNPIDNIHSWYVRGWGERFGYDPRSFKLLTTYEEEPFPWYCSGYEDQMINLNPYEKCVMMAIDLIKRSIKQQKNAKSPDKILTLLFEDMAEDPYTQLKKIEDFLGRKQTKYTSKFVSEARCPRVLDPKDREKKLKIFKKNVNKYLYESLVNLTESYEKDAYGLI